MGESMKFLFNSRYVRDLATLVVAYGISIQPRGGHMEEQDQGSGELQQAALEHGTQWHP